jgi:hypothetical protein
MTAASFEVDLSPVTWPIDARERAAGCFCVRARGRYNTSELGDREKGDQKPNTPAYRPKPIHH